MRWSLSLAAILLIACVFSGCSRQPDPVPATRIEGAGSTFAAPLIDKWAEEYHKRNTKVPDPDGEYSYPIVTFTWALVYMTYESPSKTQEVKDLIVWCLNSGKDYGEAAGNVRLGPHVVRAAEKALAAVGG